MNLFKAVLDTRNHNGVVGKITQFDTATLEFQIVTDGQINEAWESPTFELIAMKRDENPVRETDQSRFTILSKETHEVQVELKEQFLTCRGNVKMQLIVKDGERLSTSVFYIIVGESLDHGIVESHRDVAVLDELEQYVKTGYEALAYQEQRMKDVEKSTHELNELMKENESQRQEAESERQSLFEENEIQRQEVFNQQLTSQRRTFDDSQDEREGVFNDLKQNISSDFNVAQNEREYEFNSMMSTNQARFDSAMSSNQNQFNSAESSRANTFSNSQIENERVFTTNENARQTLFNTNEAARKTNETTRIANENTRKTNETSRVTAEAERQKKMIAFEAKATQLSNELDAQMERVDAFVTANEEKLLGDRDKVDYMGNTHKSVKAASDANVDWLLGEVNTAHYEGRHITATDTIEGHAKSAILKGQTLVNINRSNFVVDSTIATDYANAIAQFDANMKASTTYTVIAYSDKQYEYRLSELRDTTVEIGLNDLYPLTVGIPFVFTTGEDFTALRGYLKGDTVNIPQGTEIKILIVEGDHSNEEIPYIEGMQSVKLPVLKTVGKNLFNPSLPFDTDYYKNEGRCLPCHYDNEKKLIITDGISGEKNSQFQLLKFKPNTTYTFSGEFVGHQQRFCVHNESKQIECNGTGRFSLTITTGDNGRLYVSILKVGTPNGVYGIENLQIEEGSTATEYEPFKSNILTVNEEVELRGIGDVKDELNPLTGELIQRIGEITFDGSENWIASTNQERTAYILPHKGVAKMFRTPISDKWICEGNSNATSDTFFYIGGSYFNYITNQEISLADFKAQLSENPVSVQYFLATESVKTVDLSGDAVYSYNEVTHYDCSSEEGSLVPTLSVDVPTNLPALVSRQRATIETQKAQIQTLEIENEQLIEQNQVQDEDIALNQDAINFMLFASEMLADDNKTKGVNTMAAYLANQILKGKLDYSLVVSRYPQFKEDIDTILILEGEENLIK